jgi:hypothetical protein
VRATVSFTFLLVSALPFAGCRLILGIENPADAGAETPVFVDGSGGQGGGPGGQGGGSGGQGGGSDGGQDGATDGSPDTDQPPPPPPLTIATTSLPDALYNVSYSVVFAASGGSGAAQVWSLTQGLLPQGVSLAANGTLAGVPLQEGPFDFQITVSELPPGTATTTGRFTLIVQRKRWLVYDANNIEALNNFALYAVDVRNPAAQILVSSNLSVVTGYVDKFEFSPDGKWLAFLGAQVGARQLYVVDMTGMVPGAPRPVNEYGSVDFFAWSPDSRWLAFGDDSDQGIDILIADMTQPQAHPARAAIGVGNINGIAFVTNDLLSYWVDFLAFTQRPPGGAFGTPEMLTLYGALVQRWPDLESGLFASNGEGCQDPTWNVIDFHDPLTTRAFPGDVSVSPGRDYVAHRQNPDDQYLIYPVWGTDPLVSYPTETHFCAPGGWSHDGKLFVSAGDNDTLQVTHVDGLMSTTGTLPGTYGTVAENGPPVFSPDDRWLGFSTSLGAYVVRNDHGTLGAAVGGGVSVTAEFGEPRLAFAPNSTQLASGENGATGRPASVRLTDLRQDPPNPMDLNLQTQAGSAVFAIGWSVHSTELALMVRSGAYPSPTNLYLYSAPLTPVQLPNYPRNVTAFDLCDSSTGTCEQVTGFAFQP